MEIEKRCFPLHVLDTVIVGVHDKVMSLDIGPNPQSPPKIVLDRSLAAFAREEDSKAGVTPHGKSFGRTMPLPVRVDAI